jgi:hypothetical protein
MGDKQNTIAIMAAIISASAVMNDEGAARHAANIYEAVERELSKRRMPPQK